MHQWRPQFTCFISPPPSAEISRKSLAAYFYHTDSGYDVDPAYVNTLFRDTPAKAAAAAAPGRGTGGR